MKNKSRKIRIVILFFIGVFLFFNIVFLMVKTSNESFSKKYLSFIGKNNNELNTLFYELDLIKQNTNTFYIEYHLNMNELYYEDSSEQNNLFFDKNENRIKEFFSKYDIRKMDYNPENKEAIKVKFQKSTRFGIIPDNLNMYFKIENDNHISYYFTDGKDTINFKKMSLNRE